MSSNFENLIVQKFGGATLATPTLIKAAAARLAAQSRKGPLIAVVSAMGSTTNSLIELASQVSRRPPRRELDMLLSVGERTSMSLVSMALHDLGASAISFTGSQAGILTDEDHFNAHIVDVKAHRVEEALRQGQIVILAGFQGVSPRTKEITTLGRGGSDVTAVAMAAALGARRCEILKDVPAVFTADPRVVHEAKPLSTLGYDELLEMTFWGGKVLHYRSVELARRRNVSLYVGPADVSKSNEGTVISLEKSMYEAQRPLSLNSHDRVLEIELGSGEPGEQLRNFEKALSMKEIPAPQILAWHKEGSRVFISAPPETLNSIEADFRNASPRVVNDQWSTVTLTCDGSLPADLCAKMLSLLSNASIPVEDLRTSSLSATVLVPRKHRADALRTLHILIP